jgi:hypothetical protein
MLNWTIGLLVTLQKHTFEVILYTILTIHQILYFMNFQSHANDK